MSTIYTVFRSLRTVFLILAGVGLFAVPALAADVFTVSGVKVDAKAENAVAAREKAFSMAQTAAFTALAVRLLGEDEAKAYKIPEPLEISTMIKDFEITAERISAVEYIATYTFRFEGNAVRDRFNMQGMKYTAANTKPMLILPFHQVGQNIALWKSNPWLDAWLRNPARGGLVSLAVPRGDALDVAAIGDDQALNYRPDGLAGMLSRYNAGEAVILVARPGPVDAGEVPVDLAVMIYRADASTPEYIQTLKITPDANTPAAALYDKAVKQVRALLQKNWKSTSPAQDLANQAVSANPLGNPINAYNPYDTLPVASRVNVDGDLAAQGMGSRNITVHVQFANMQEWVATRQALQSVPGIAHLRVQSVSPREARVNLQFNGSVDQLRTVLAQNDMVLTAPQNYTGEQDMGYSLSLRRPAGY